MKAEPDRGAVGAAEDGECRLGETTFVEGLLHHVAEPLVTRGSGAGKAELQLMGDYVS